MTFDDFEEVKREEEYGFSEDSSIDGDVSGPDEEAQGVYSNAVLGYMAERIQKAYRKHLLRCSLRFVLRFEQVPATRMQRWWRNAQRKIGIKVSAAVKLQALFRASICRKQCAAAHRKMNMKKHAAAVALQSFYRGSKCRARAKYLLEVQSAVIIQRMFIERRRRSELARLRAEANARKQRSVAALRIQALHRMQSTRMLFRKKQNASDVLHRFYIRVKKIRRAHAASTLQFWWIKCMESRAVRKKHALHRMHKLRVTQIRYSFLLASFESWKEHSKVHAAAICVQRLARNHACWVTAKQKRLEMLQRNEKAANKLQSAAKQWMWRRRSLPRVTASVEKMASYTQLSPLKSRRTRVPVSPVSPPKSLLPIDRKNNRLPPLNQSVSTLSREIPGSITHALRTRSFSLPTSDAAISSLKPAFVPMKPKCPKNAWSNNFTHEKSLAKRRKRTLRDFALPRK